MTIIPADTKDAKGPQGPPPMQTTNPFPDPILEQYAYPHGHPHDLPPYSETDAGSEPRDIRPPPPPAQQPIQQPVQKIPESNAINAHSEVIIKGPLHVLGYVLSSKSSVFDSDSVEIDLSNPPAILSSKMESKSTAKSRRHLT